MEKIKLENTKGTDKEFDNFRKLWNKLGIKVTPVKEFEVNLDFFD